MADAINRQFALERRCDAVDGWQGSTAATTNSRRGEAVRCPRKA